jgi:two-component system nitrogen regulation response regulator GlnG
LTPAEELSVSEPLRIPALTILHHADMRRIGEVARLPGLSQGREAWLSRLEPEFVPVGGGPGRPLADPFLSRSAIRLAGSGGAVRLSVPSGMRLDLNGVAVEGERTLLRSEIESGAVLELRRRTAILLHLLSSPAKERAPRLGLVGESDAMEQLRADVLRVADLPVAVLVRGETGSGKELVARALHEQSSRAAGPCICVSMAAIPPSTAASELFGHAPGSFTGAVREHAGHFVRASGGTLFLDEIGEMPVEVQTMLLRVVETQENVRLGSTRAEKIDVRLVAATDADLEESIQKGRFREALFHRLAGFQLRVPPLRDRRDDIGRLLRHFFELELEIAGEPERLSTGPDARSCWLPASLVAKLVLHDWPGNVRQLRNVVRQIVISSRGLAAARIDATVAALLEGPAHAAPSSAIVGEPPAAAARGPREIPDEELVEALRGNQWRTSATARALGISRTTLYALIDKSPRIRKARDVPADELARCLAECGNDLEAAAARLEVSKRGLQLRLREGAGS